MKQLIIAILVLISMLSTDSARTDVAHVRAVPFFPLDAGSQLKRGMNLGNMLEAPSEGD